MPKFEALLKRETISQEFIYEDLSDIYYYCGKIGIEMEDYGCKEGGKGHESQH